MKKLLLTLAATTMLSSAAYAEDVKIGVVMGYTGPIESMASQMAPAAELAIKEVNDAGGILDGMKVVPVRGDSTCVDSAAATATAERLISTDGIKAMVGPTCSGATGAVLQNVGRPKGIVMISPSATSPALSTAEDDGLFFRTAPSDARQGEIIAEILKEKGVKSVAISYTNNDYGKGLSDSIKNNFEKAGGKVTIVAAHEDGKGDYSAEVGALAQAGGDMLVVAGYADQGGKGIIQASLDAGAFDKFFLPDGMVADSLTKALGKELEGAIGDKPGNDSPGGAKFVEIAKSADPAFDGTGIFTGESYDAAALIMLAMQAAGSSDSAKLKDKVLEVANAPGEKIYPGELAKALKILKDGGDIDYVGATAVEMKENGESAGSFGEVTIKDGKFETVKYW